jgi:RNA polymerase sigma-70 factor (ECF subfamily)
VAEGAPTPGIAGAAPEATRGVVAEVLARERRRLLARLVRRLGMAQLALAEDAVQVAAMRALERWPVQGLPDAPLAWLTRVAWNEALDRLRRAAHEVPWDGSEGEWPQPLPAPRVQAAPERLAGELDDEELALLFAACHPSLPAATQVVLALRALTPLALRTLAEGLFTTEAALAQRVARSRVQLECIAVEVPAGAELAPRRESVLTALWLLFHAGTRAHARHDGGATAGIELAWEAIRLARSLAAHAVAGHPDAHALAANLLLHGARLTGQLDERGDIVLLPGQPRDRWDAGMIRLGIAHLEQGMGAARLSRWHLLAGIAAEHALAADYASTNWRAIVGYYDQLLALDGSPAPRLAHAIALAEAGAPAVAREKLLALLPDTPAALRAHTMAALARTHERESEGSCARSASGERPALAAAAASDWIRRAIRAAVHEAEARVLARRLAAMEGTAAGEGIPASPLPSGPATPRTSG